MFLKITVEHLSEHNREWLVKQFSDRNVVSRIAGNSVIVELEAPFEKCMEYIAIAQYFPDYEVKMKQNGYERPRIDEKR